MCPAIQPCSSHDDAACQQKQKADDCFARVAEVGIRADSKGDASSKKILLETLQQHRRDQKAARRARASAAVYDVDISGKLNQSVPCLALIDTSSEAALRRVESSLGLDANSLHPSDFANEAGAYRAALFYDQCDRQYVLAFRGTNKNNLVDWKNNINNQLPNATASQAPSYFAAENLGRLLSGSDPVVEFTGHSKGGGEVFEALSKAPGSTAYVFNAAGPSPRISVATKAHIAQRVQAYQVGGEMLNLMQDETEPQRTIANMKWLRDQVDHGFAGTAMAVKITERDNEEIALKAALKEKTAYLFNTSDEEKAAQASLDGLAASFASDRSSFIAQLDESIAQGEENLRNGKPVKAFAQVLGERRVLGGSPDRTEPGIMALKDHTMDSMAEALNTQLLSDQAMLEKSLPQYAPAFERKVKDCTESFHFD